MNSSNLSSIPDYLAAGIPEAIEKTERLKHEGSFRFLFMTDQHHAADGNQLSSAAVVRELSGKLDLAFIASGGDISVNGTKAAVTVAQRQIADALRSARAPLLPMKGNHDDNSIYDFYKSKTGTANVVMPEETHALLFAHLDGLIEADPNHPYGLYYYFDVPHAKVRAIVLNTHDIPYVTGEDGKLRYNGQWKYAFSDRQLNWAAQQALRFDHKTDAAAWKIIVFSHIPILQDGLTGTDHAVENGEVMWNLLLAFRDGKTYRSAPSEGDFAQSVEVDFSGQGKRTVIGCFHGHVHYDQVLVRDGIPVITSLCSTTTEREFDDAPERIAGTLSETAFDIVTVDFRQGAMRLTRFGAGEDRTIPYER